MEIQTHYPKNPILKTYIEYYYFLKTSSKDFSSVYYSFPNTSHSLNIHKNVTCDIASDYIHVKENNKNNFLTIVQGKYETPLLVRLKGRFDKVTIIFKPLGLNHFIDRPFACVAGRSSQIFEEWQSDPDYISFLNNFYKTENNIERVKFLENFLLSKHHNLNQYAILQNAIEQLNNFEVEHSIEEIAGNAGMNLRSFSRLFYNQLGISPVGFKKIARFRHSLKNKLFSDNFKRLTDIGYESNFYDQSYFIKMYKKLTKDPPTSFFKSIEKLADNQLILKFFSQ